MGEKMQIKASQTNTQSGMEAFLSSPGSAQDKQTQIKATPPQKI